MRPSAVTTELPPGSINSFVEGSTPVTTSAGVLTYVHVRLVSEHATASLL